MNHPLSPQQARSVAEARERALQTPPAQLLSEDFPEVRPEILLSWKRSLLAGVDPEATDFPVDPDVTLDSKLLRVAEPILDRLADQVAGMSSWGFLTDKSSRLLTVVAENEPDYARLNVAEMTPGLCFGEEIIGTNGIGSARELQHPFMVSGAEHFRRSTALTTTGVPILDPTTRRYMGTLAINCREEFASGSLLPLVQELGRSIESQLLSNKPDKERAIFYAFEEARRRFPGAIVACTDDLMISTAAARHLYGPADGELLQSLARDTAVHNKETTVHQTLSNGKVVEFRTLPVPQPHRGFAALLLMKEVDTAPANFAVKPKTADMVKQALGATKRVLLIGERGAGKEWFARQILTQPESQGPEILDCIDSAEAPTEWLASARTAFTRSAKIILLHINQVHEEALEALAGLVSQGNRTVIATCREGTKDDPALAAMLESFSVVVRIPPLRERRAEIPEIASEIISGFRNNHNQGISSDRDRLLATKALAALMNVDWPGNIRQLKQVLFTSAIRAGGSQILETHLPDEHRTASRGGNLTLMERTERQVLQTALNDCGGNRDTAAAKLGISRATIYRKLRKYKIQ